LIQMQMMCIHRLGLDWRRHGDLRRGGRSWT
jgi:hypothetical protein